MWWSLDSSIIRARWSISVWGVYIYYVGRYGDVLTLTGDEATHALTHGAGGGVTAGLLGLVPMRLLDCHTDLSVVD